MKITKSKEILFLSIWHFKYILMLIPNHGYTNCDIRNDNGWIAVGNSHTEQAIKKLNIQFLLYNHPLQFIEATYFIFLLVSKSMQH